MAKEIFIPYGTSGLSTLYATVRRPSDGFRWYTVTPAWEAYNSGHVATGYGIALTEEGATGNYYADFPAGITGAGRYEVVAYRQLGASPAWPADTVVGTQAALDWTGSSVESPQTGDAYALANGANGFVAIKGNTAAIVAKLPTNAIADETLVIAATNAIVTAVGSPAQASALASLVTTVGVAGAGLTAVGLAVAPPTLGQIQAALGANPVFTGTIAAVTDSTHVTLDSGVGSVDVTGATLLLPSGTGQGQARRILTYNTGTRAAVLDSALLVLPDTSTPYAVVSGPSADKLGYKLAADGVDLVMIESGSNLRQAVQAIAAEAAGKAAVSGNTVTFAGLGVATIRLTATTDSTGQRTAVTPSLTA